MITNKDRAERAHDAIVAYRGSDHSALNEAIGDLIGDLLHLAESRKIDPFQMVRNGMSHFACECIDQPDGMSHETRVELYVHARPYRIDETGRSKTQWREWRPQP